MDKQLVAARPKPTPGSFAGFFRLALTSPDRIGVTPKYFYAVDLLRGLAAVAILFWHYVHFFTKGTVFLPHDSRQDPLYQQFWLLYDHGGNAVQLFWLVSGFTFSSVYTQRQVTARVFAVHRLARLFPLHWLTLFCVAGLQLLSLHLTGSWSIYGYNDWPHFIDHLFLTNGWGSQVRLSFNGPVWTVSVEIVFYSLFWILLPRLFMQGLLYPLVLAMAFLALNKLADVNIAQGGFYFFAGCGLYPVYLACQGQRLAKLLVTLLPLSAAVYLCIVLHAVGAGSIMLFTAAVLAAAFWDVERTWPGGRRITKWVGDNTYGTYLWHVPVQIVLLLTVERAGWSPSLFLAPWFLIGYLALVIAVARTSFVLFEQPSRTFINGWVAGPIVRPSGSRRR